MVPILGPGGAAGKKRAAHIQEYGGTKEPPSSFPPHWTEPDVRGSLISMQGRICAYCGADTAETGDDADHFRPKGKVFGDPDHGGYWWLAYDFDNYFLSCTTCNQRLKSNKFPLQDGAARVRFEDRHRLSEERRVLPDPAVDPVEDWISVDPRNPSGRLAPKADLPAESAARIKSVLVFFRLNRRSGLTKRRMEIKREVIGKLAEGKADEIKHLAIRFQPHSLVAKQILEAHAPGALPTPEEEIEWLLNSLSAELIQKLKDLRTEWTDRDEREANELIWALAILWKDPPAGTPDSVKAYLDGKGLTELVQKFFALL